MLRGISSLSLLAVPCPKLGLDLFCFFAGGPSAVCLSRLSRTSFAFFEGLLLVVAAVAVAVVVVAVVLVVVVVVAVSAATVVVTAAVVVAVVVVVVVTVDVSKLVAVTAAIEVTATVTGFESLLGDFRFLDRKTSDVDVVDAFAVDFSI
jgi:hypothetical protein